MVFLRNCFLWLLSLILFVELIVVDFRPNFNGVLMVLHRFYWTSLIVQLTFSNFHLRSHHPILISIDIMLFSLVFIDFLLMFTDLHFTFKDSEQAGSQTATSQLSRPLASRQPAEPASQQTASNHFKGFSLFSAARDWAKTMGGNCRQPATSPHMYVYKNNYIYIYTHTCHNSWSRALLGTRIRGNGSYKPPGAP